MDVAGLNIVMDADFTSVFSGMAQANNMFQNLASNIIGAFSNIPDLGKKLNFTSNGASQAAQDAREAATASRQLAAAELDRVKADDIANKASERQSRTIRNNIDEYGQLVAANQALVRAYYNEAAAQLKVGDTSVEAKAKLEQMRLEALRGQQQLQQIEQGAGRYQRTVGNYATGTAALAQQLRQTTTEIPNFFISARTGFQSLSNNLPGIFNELTRIRDANQQLTASGQPTVSVFKQFLGAFNPLNIAIGVGVGLLTAYGPELVKVVQGWFAGSQAAQQQAANIKELDDATKKATKTATDSASKEVSNAMLLYKASQDVKLSYEERKNAADELIKISPTIFKGLNDEAIVAGQAEGAYRKLIDAIKDKISLAVNEEQVTVLYKQQQAALNYAKALGIAKQAQKDLESANEGDVSGAGPAAAKIAKKAKEDIAKLGVTVPIVATGKNIEEAAQNLDKANSNLDEKIAETATLKGKLDNIFKPAPPKIKVKDYTDQLEDLDAKIQGYAKKNLGFKDDSASQIIDTDKLKKEADKAGDVLKNYIATRKSVDAEVLGNMLDSRQKEEAEWQKRVKAAELAAKEMRLAIAASLAGLATDTAEAIGTAIGNLGKDGSGNLGDLFKSIGSLIGTQIINLGKQLVIAGGLMEAIWNAIEGLGIPTGGTAAIIIGLGAIAAGAALKASLSKSASGTGKVAMADGALAYGPTSALVGEYATARSNPEVIAPLDKLQSILRKSGGGGSGQQVFIPDVRIQGQDLLLVFKRADSSFKR